jgi:hypothetical protein
MHDHIRFDWLRHRVAARAAVAMPVITLTAAVLITGCGTANPPHATVAPRTARALHASAQSRLVQTRRSSATQTARLPMASTYGTTPTAPQDPAPFKPETGIVIHPTRTRVSYARPGGPAVGALPTTELGSPTWVPVVQSRPGWDRILLPTRPNRSTGWIYLVL